MSTIWAAPAPTRVLNLRGAPVAERRPGDDDDDDDDATGPHGAKPSQRAGDEPFEDVAGAARGPRVGRIDAWRDQGFASAREQRDALKSDLGRYNARRRRQGRAPLTEDEFDAMIAHGGGDEVSSISGSDDSDSDSDSDSDEGGGEAGVKGGRGAFAAVRGATQGGAQIVFKDDLGDAAYAVWRCVLEDPSRKTAQKRLDADTAVASLRALRDGAKPWAVVLARGGHFAASVFDPTKFAGGTNSGARVEKKPRGPIENVVPPGAAIAHKTFHRYVVRAKAGGRQSTKDAGGGKTIKSAGSSMRRANERALEEEIRECLSGWRSVLNGCALIFVSASKTDRKTLFDAPGKGKEPCLGRGDERVRGVPFATRRPTFNETRRVVARLASASPVEDAVGAEGGAEGGADLVTREVDAGGGALTDAQRDRMAQIESRATAAAAALRGLDFGAGAGVHAGDGGGDEGDDGGDASGSKPLSKKEKEKIKKQRAKERAKAAAAADGEKGPAPAPAAPPPPEPARSRVGKSGGGGKAAALLAKAKQGEANKRNEAVRAHDARFPPASFSHPNLSPRFLSPCFLSPRFRDFTPDGSPQNSRRRVSTDFSRPSPQSEERRASGQRRRGQRRSRGRRTGDRSPEAAGPSLVARAAAAARGIDPIALLPKAAMAAAALTVVMSASAGARRPARVGNVGGFRRVMR